MRAVELRVGVDVGGTNTDAVVLDAEDRLLARVKTPTTPDVTSGIREALRLALADPAVERDRVTHVMVGTTHATNALLERRALQRVAVLRLGAPSTLSVPPLVAWPDDLRAAVEAGATVVRGGVEFDGREQMPVDREAVARFLDSVAGRAEAVAITGMFSPVQPEQERATGELARELLGEDVPISLGHEVGSLGLIERENATVLNAALTGVARDVAGAIAHALAEHALDASVYFAQNDGTLMALEYATRFPVLTIGSGPANSLRGAAFLSGLGDALVADVGGTSTDLGVIQGGFPRESSLAVEIGGIRTNFRMPDILSIALGGGTIVAADGDGVLLGPASVGYRLSEEALSFGGPTATLSDAAIAAGRASFGSSAPPAATLPLLAFALARADELVADAVDRIKLGRGERPLVVVGGGSVLVPDRLPGVSEVVRPANYDVANAIGAATALASGRWEGVVHLNRGRDAVMEAATHHARDRAIEAGADPSALETIELEEVPLAYLDRPAARVTVKVAGPVATMSAKEGTR